MTPTLAPLQDLTTSRQLFLAAAEAAGATLEHHPHPLAGPSGEALATDVARLGPGPGRARAVLVIASGTHGVEGHMGSGVQRLLLDGHRLQGLPPGVAVLLVHAVNPYGMAWSRRVDHDNIDVNRNFVDLDGGALPENPHYREVDEVLNPCPADLDPGDGAWMGEIARFQERVGPEVAFRTLSGGQYDHPAGVQFGGRRPSWSRRTLEAVWAQHLQGAAAVVHLDLHSGLGPYGDLSLFQTADEAEAAAEAAARWFPGVLRSDRPGTRDALQVGLLGPWLDARSPAPLTVPVVVEVGTRDVATVLGAMRADNWLHHHGDPGSARGREIRARTRDAFFVDDGDWRTTAAEHGLATVDAALDGVGTVT